MTLKSLFAPLEFVISTLLLEPAPRKTFYFILGLAQLLLDYSRKAVKCKRRGEWEGIIPAQKRDEAGMEVF